MGSHRGPGTLPTNRNVLLDGDQSSAEAVTFPWASECSFDVFPPTIKTSPSCSWTAPCLARGKHMVPLGVKEFVFGSNISESASIWPVNPDSSGALEPGDNPPVINTRPSVNSVIVGSMRTTSLFGRRITDSFLSSTSQAAF
jgi:hypothetical protein